MVPKSGSPVLGHIDVNSGQSISISKSRSGRGFGNVSRTPLDITRDSSIQARKHAESRVVAIDTCRKRALGYARFPAYSARSLARAITKRLAASALTDSGG